MRYIKPYEYFEIKIGDWILYKDKYISSRDFELFSTAIPGKVVKIDMSDQFPRDLKYTVEYSYIPNNIKPFFQNTNHQYVLKDEIIAKMTENESQMILNTIKYNL